MKPTKARASTAKKVTKPKPTAKPKAAGKRVKRVYFFGGGKAEGNKEMKNLLGGKGANLAEMTNIGVPVPPGFTITTEVCTEFNKAGKKLPKDLDAEVTAAVAKMEKLLGKKFGDPSNPLLVSVRSGARASMPGMMDTILNLGLNDETAAGLAAASGNERFAFDSYRRFVAMYGDVVLEMKPERKEDHDPFEVLLSAKKKAVGVKVDSELPASALKELVAEFKAAIKQHKGIDFPTNPLDQLTGAIKAVFRSWENDRANVYRKLNNIPSDWGTAVNVQAMVFGNKGDDSATGVCFTRNPASGENEFYGEFLVNAQGEDVVAGVRTPRPAIELEQVWPDVYAHLMEIRKTLESEMRDMQDFEFTIEKGRLFMLQTRNGKRTGLAAIRIAVDLADQGLISPDEALMRIEPEQLNQLLRPIFGPDDKLRAVAEGRVKAKGLPAGPGAASGRVVFSAADAEAWAARGEQVLLVRDFTSPKDIRGMDAAQGILTAQGGMTSHAALVARQMGKVCIVGCGALDIDMKARRFKAGDATVAEGDWISIDGFTGEVILGQLETRPPEVLQVLLEKSMKAEESGSYRYYAEIMEWADKTRTMGVRTNADQPDQSRDALAFGAEGIGLCRTEHMFFEGERIMTVREMLLADDAAAREAALAKLLPMQRDDFAGIFRVMGERPVTVRTLDPPLHEFLPHDDVDTRETASALGISEDIVRAKVDDLHESNPMLGHRGCRLGIAYPEITAMQVRAILEAACLVQKEGQAVHPEIMIPLVGTKKELEHQAAVVRDVAARVFAEQGVTVDYLVGTMIEIPRAALTADKIAEVAEFFSFGTNDLTQMTLGVSRDDAGKFLGLYTSEALEIWPADPFATLDQEGVGQLVEMGIERGRSTRPQLKVGICGEQGGDPETVKFCHRAGMNYVSCSPFRLPVARLAAAQAAIEARGDLQLEK